MTDDATTEGESGSEETQQKQGQTFSQADVDRIVKERIQRVETKYADYSDLKAKADGAKTLEERLGSVEAELNTTKAGALRASIAAEFGISTKKGAKGEPSDADLFLTGADESTLTAQAQRLAGRQADLKKQGNVAPKEGATKTTGGSETDMREFARALFNSPD